MLALIFVYTVEITLPSGNVGTAMRIGQKAVLCTPVAMCVYNIIP